MALLAKTRESFGVCVLFVVSEKEILPEPQWETGRPKLLVNL